MALLGALVLILIYILNFFQSIQLNESRNISQVAEWTLFDAQLQIDFDQTHDFRILDQQLILYKSNQKAFAAYEFAETYCLRKTETSIDTFPLAIASFDSLKNGILELRLADSLPFIYQKLPYARIEP